MKKLLPIILIFCFSALFAQKQKEQSSNTLSPKEKQQGWVLLFDGTTLNGWKGFNVTDVPKNWSVEGNQLTCSRKGENMEGDILTAEKYENFELVIDWKVSAKANSGIFYHIVEGSQYHSPYETGPEYQVIDDLGWPDKLGEWQKTGSDYAMHPADTTKKVLQPVGQWNHTKIIVNRGHVQHWLNGKKIVDFQAWTPDWYGKVKACKFKELPDYGKAKVGYIGLQNEQGSICFKNIKLRKL